MGERYVIIMKFSITINYTNIENKELRPKYKSVDLYFASFFAGFFPMPRYMYIYFFLLTKLGK